MAHTQVVATLPRRLGRDQHRFSRRAAGGVRNGGGDDMVTGGYGE